jgi:hypothetical protein
MGKTAKTKQGHAIPQPPDLHEPPVMPIVGPWVVVKVRAGLPMRMPSGLDLTGKRVAGRRERPEFVAVAELLA